MFTHLTSAGRITITRQNGFLATELEGQPIRFRDAFYIMARYGSLSRAHWQALHGLTLIPERRLSLP